MGNSLGGKRTAKVMKINGETMKLKTPVQAGEIVKDYPGHVLLDSEAVKHFGIRAKPLEPYRNLEPKRLYFLVELPQFPQKVPRRVRSGINMSAKDRLESLLLSRRSVSDLSLIKPAGGPVVVDDGEGKMEGPMRVRVRLPKAQVEKLMSQSRDEAEAAERIVDLCVSKSGSSNCSSSSSSNGREVAVLEQQAHRDRYKRRVGFLPVNQGDNQLAVAS
ncbi:hypothetical protein Ancab_018445 [Ancistrocladus abbreviatus]